MVVGVTQEIAVEEIVADDLIELRTDIAELRNAGVAAARLVVVVARLVVVVARLVVVVARLVVVVGDDAALVSVLGELVAMPMKSSATKAAASPKSHHAFPNLAFVGSLGQAAVGGAATG